MSAPGRSGRPSIVPYAVLAGLCVALGIVGIMLQGKANRALQTIEESKRQYRKMIEISDASVKPRSESEPNTVERTEKWKEMGGYLPTVQRESGIPPQNMPEIREIPEGNLFDKRSGAEWFEYGASITVRSSREQPLQMSQLADFLDRIERKQPLLKTTMFTVTIHEGNEVTGTVEMRYWIRKPAE